MIAIYSITLKKLKVESSKKRAIFGISSSKSPTCSFTQQFYCYYHLPLKDTWINSLYLALSKDLTVQNDCHSVLFHVHREHSVCGEFVLNLDTFIIYTRSLRRVPWYWCWWWWLSKSPLHLQPASTSITRWRSDWVISVIYIPSRSLVLLPLLWGRCWWISGMIMTCLQVTKTLTIYLRWIWSICIKY